jgi:cytochrome P450
MEVQRFSSLVPLVNHVALEDTGNCVQCHFTTPNLRNLLKITELSGYVIPKGTILMANSYQVHHDPQYWERPDDFYPPHFLNEDGSVKYNEAYIPFSIGSTLVATQMNLINLN